MMSTQCVAVTPSNGNDHAARATNHNKQLIRKVQRLREVVLAYLPDSVDSRDFAALHAAIGAYLAMPADIREQIERSDLNG